MTENRQLTVCKIVIGIAIVNFVAFWIGAVYFGGDAVAGAVRNGHYFLRSHGRYTEVTETIFRYSLWHTHSVWVTHPLGLLAAFFYTRIKKDQKLSACPPVSE